MTKRKRAEEYYWVTDGEWVAVPWRGFKEQCCSCGYVHKTDFRVVEGTLQFRSTVDSRATGGARKNKGSQ